MPKKSNIKNLATLAVRIGINCKKGDRVLISASVESYEFVRLIVKEAYKAGAKIVNVKWDDNYNSRETFLHAPLDVLKIFPLHAQEELKYVVDNNTSLIRVLSEHPGIYQDVDPNVIQTIMIERAKNEDFKKYRAWMMNSTCPWTIVAVPNEDWARKVFPDLPIKKAVNKLWDSILETSRALSSNGSPIKQWKDHQETLITRGQKLTAYQFKELHFVSAKTGTDLHVGLVKNHYWLGGDEVAIVGKRHFAANIPTEEIFSMPHKYNVNGVVYATKPLNYQGKLIENFHLVFKDGKVVKYHAEKNEETLKKLVEIDEGSSHLGEVAIVPFDSPINNTGILFYETLFDENASCHLALGESYPSCVEGGSTLTKEQANEVGSNRSLIHVDFMFGAEDMQITGFAEDGTGIIIFKDGNFVI